jgi:hypothetical protein
MVYQEKSGVQKEYLIDGMDHTASSFLARTELFIRRDEALFFLDALRQLCSHFLHFFFTQNLPEVHN